MIRGNNLQLLFNYGVTDFWLESQSESVSAISIPILSWVQNQKIRPISKTKLS